MSINIPLLGLELHTPENSATAGALASAVNIMHQDGALRPSLDPSIAKDLKNANITHAYIHKGNYIYATSDGKVYCDGNATPLLVGFTVEDMSSIGNILIVSSSSAILYFRYLEDKKEYLYLGENLPEIRMDLGLKLNFVTDVYYGGKFKLKTAGNTITADDAWQTIISKRFSLTKTGDMHMDPTGLQIAISRPLRLPEVSLDGNREYRIKFQLPNYHVSPATIFALHGVNADTGQVEQITGMAADGETSAQVWSTALHIKAKYTDIYAIISMPHSIDTPLVPNVTLDVVIERGVAWESANPPAQYVEFDTATYDYFMGCVNKFTAKQIKENSRFVYPFLARYAVRMYDGSYCYVSDPVLLLPNTGYAPCVRYAGNTESTSSSNPTNYNSHKVMLAGFAADIQYKLTHGIPECWSELIDGVDIFVSPQAYGYTQSAEYGNSDNEYAYTDMANNKGRGCLYFDNACISDEHIDRDLKSCMDTYAAGDSQFLKMAPRKKDEVLKQIKNTSVFRRVASIPFAGLIAADQSVHTVDIPNGALSGFDALPALADTTLPYEGYAGARIHAYNSRVHFYDAKVILRRPMHYPYASGLLTSPQVAQVETFVHVASDIGDRIIRTDTDILARSPWFFSPYEKAYKAVVIEKLSASFRVIEIPLSRHPFLNGSYYLASDLTKPIDGCKVSISTVHPYSGVAVNNLLSAQSSIYVSAPANPFVFPAASAVAVGSDKVLALSCAARPLSTGQFGQFPLYAFTSDGIWALTPSEVGSYVARQPISRDVCINPEGICQLDSSVLFPTAKGLMSISGSEVSCISTAVASRFPISLPVDKYYTKLRDQSGAWSAQDAPPPFLSMLDEARTIYDYANKRIITFYPNHMFAYACSLESGMWSSIWLPHTLKHALNSYPEAMAVAKDGKVYNFSQSNIDINDLGDASWIIPIQFATRPLSLDDPSLLKVINAAKVEGYIDGNYTTTLYGSRDCRHWVPIAASKGETIRHIHGSGYKYFRVSLIGCVTADSYISHLRIDATPKQIKNI